MNLFNKIPDNFFSILSSKNKNIYGLAIVTLYDCLTLYHNHIRKSDFLDLLKNRGEGLVNNLIIEEEDYETDKSLIYEPTLQGKYNLIVKRLVDTGWIILDQDIKTGVEYILIPSYSISMLKIVYEFVSDGDSQYVSNVRSTYADLQYEDENQSDFMYRALVSAVNKTRDLELEVTKLDHSIRVFHKQLANMFSPNEVLNQHFDIAREDVVDPIYHPLKTNDSIILYNGPIASILKRWLNTPDVFDKIVSQALMLNTSLKTKEDAQKDVIKKINYIQDTYNKLTEEMNDIDNAQSNYTKATTEKVIYLNNSDKTIKGKLESIFLSLAKVINGEPTGYPNIVKDINNSLLFYQQGYIDSDSLTKPYKRNDRYEGEPMALDDFEQEVNEGLMQSLLQIMDAYSDEKIMEFMEDAFKDENQIDVKKIPVKSVEDFIMVILGTVKADSRSSFYDFVRPDDLEYITKEDKYEMPNFQYVRRKD
jgi:hypothetical protein